MTGYFLYFQRWLSYIFDVPIERTRSDLEEPLSIKLRRGRLILDGPHVNYAYGGLHDFFKRTFNHYALPRSDTRNALILGFGVGDVARLLQKKNPRITIDGVEIDTEMIRLYHTYFARLKRTGTIHVIHQDAEKFLHHTDTKYDLIIMDVFLDLEVPPQFQTETFLQGLKDHLTRRGILIYNQIVTTSGLNRDHQRLNERFKHIFGEFEELHILGNKPLVYRSSLPEDPAVNEESQKS